jgi:hypothetical protein
MRSATPPPPPRAPQPPSSTPGQADPSRRRRLERHDVAAVGRPGDDVLDQRNDACALRGARCTEDGGTARAAQAAARSEFTRSLVKIGAALLAEDD